MNWTFMFSNFLRHEANSCYNEKYCVMSGNHVLMQFSHILHMMSYWLLVLKGLIFFVNCNPVLKANQWQSLIHSSDHSADEVLSMHNSAALIYFPKVSQIFVCCQMPTLGMMCISQGHQANDLRCLLRLGSGAPSA